MVSQPVPPLVAPRARSTGSKGWTVLTTLLLLPAVIPPLALFVSVVGEGSGLAVPTLRLLELLGATLLLAAAVTATAVTLGVATAWVTSRLDIPGRRAWIVVAALPLVMPSYVAALTLIAATGPGGVISRLFGVVVPSPYGFWGAWLALSVFTAPLVHVTLIPALRAIDPSLEEAATGLGAARWRALMTVTLPQLRPALISSALLVGLYTIGDFGAVSLLRYDTFTRAIYALYQGQIDRRPAMTLAAALIVIAVVILIGERRTRGRATYSVSRPPRRRSLHTPTPRGRLAALTFLGAYVGITLAVPALVLGWWLVRGLGAGQALVFPWTEVGRSLAVAVMAAVATAVAALPVAMATVRRRSRMAPLFEAGMWGAYSLPHIAIGLAFLVFAVRWIPPLYQTVPLLIIAYMAMYLPYTVGSVQDGMHRTSMSVDEASRGLGRGPLQTFWRITLPLATPGMVAGGLLVFLNTMKELPATLLLRPSGFETVAVRIWSATGEGLLTRASAAALVLLLISAIPLLVVMTRDIGD